MRVGDWLMVVFMGCMIGLIGHSCSSACIFNDIEVNNIE